MHQGGRFLKHVSLRLIGKRMRRKQCVGAFGHFSQRLPLDGQLPLLPLRKRLGRFSLPLFCLPSRWLTLLCLAIPMMLLLRYLGNTRAKRLKIRNGGKTGNARMWVCFHKALQRGIRWRQVTTLDTRLSTALADTVGMVRAGISALGHPTSPTRLHAQHCFLVGNQSSVRKLS
jgi:hypothetical protein